MLYPRKGAEQQVERVYELAQKYGVSIPNIPLAGMKNDMRLHAKIRPFVDAFALGQQHANDTAGQAHSESWQAFLGYYGVLGSMAERIPELATELRPVIEFMAVGPRKTKATPPVTP